MKYSIPIIFFLFILWIISEANQGNSNIFISLSAAVPYGDKLGHVVLYGGLTALVNSASGCHQLQVGRFKSQSGTVLVLIFALAEELSQGLLATRSLDVGDAIADVVGITIGAFVARKYCRERNVKF